ncbi:CAP domain-containing protein [Actinacidiphila sp. bgisy167]|uniref:CAP domain-containing protein n=1 Tax=Actinacidiphila sp. bgisy167 TaxID=3413797 RepID=UPI003D76590D
MTKNRRAMPFRKTTVAVLAVAAAGVPSVAMACVGAQQGPRYGGPRAQSPSQAASQVQTEVKGRGDHGAWGGSWRGSAGGFADLSSGGTWTKRGPWWGGKPSWASAAAPAAPAPAPSSAPSAAPASQAASSGAALKGAPATVLSLVNKERAKAGCTALKANPKLTEAAQDHSKDMASQHAMSHTGSDGSSPADRISSEGYDWSRYGENVAYGYSSASSVMRAWMASPDHKRNILDCSFKEIGIALAQPGNYWTQDFGAAR